MPNRLRRQPPRAKGNHYDEEHHSTPQIQATLRTRHWRCDCPFDRRSRPVPEFERLSVFIGRWITDGETAGSAEAAPVRIIASDIYQWVPGGHFVIHSAYGRIGDIDVGGLEVIGYDSATDQYRTHFFDSQGNIATQTLSCQDGVSDVAGCARPLQWGVHGRRQDADGASRTL